ncbi:folding of proteins upon ATP hydrolysis, partial [Rhizoctonia solani]
MSLSLTQKWLKQVLGPYPQKDQIYNDVDATLAAYPTLRPKNDVYTFNDGRAQLLLCVHGLIPITFRQATYNIPIALWLPLEYPRLPPLVYVVPTSDMLVKSSKNVDPSGECAFEYLDNWRRKSEGCNLRALIEVMQDTFSREPPVYAKPKSTAPSTPSTAIRAASPASGPLPHRPPPPLPSTSSQPATSHQQPPNLSAQSSPGASERKSLANTSTATSSVAPPKSDTSHSARVYLEPTRPSPTRSPSTPGPHVYQQHNRGNSIGSSISGNHLPPSQAQSPPNRWSMPSQPGITHPPMRPPPTQPQPPPPPPPTAYQQYSNSAAPLAAPAPTPIINVPTPPAPPAPRPNFLDEDDISTQVNEAPPSPNAPPRPINPELLRLHHDLHAKITVELSALSNALAGDNERLRATQGDLLAGEPAIRDEMARLEAVRSVCTTVGDRLQDVVARAEANMHHLKSKGDPEVDELVCSTAIVYNQYNVPLASCIELGKNRSRKVHKNCPNIGTRAVYETSIDREDQRGITNWREVPCYNSLPATTTEMSVTITQVFIGNVVNTPALGQLEILQEQVILVDAHGFIAEMCPLAAPTPAALHYLHSMPASSIVRLPPTSFFSPTFIDLHLHAPQFLYLGTGLHLPLLIWLDEYAYRAEERLDSDPELARKACYGVALRLAENGTGAVLAFGTINEDTNIILAEAFQATILREPSTSASLVSARSFIRRCRGLVSAVPPPLRLVEPVLTPRFVPTCSDAVLRGLALISRGEKVKIQSHLAEAHDQIDYVRQSRGKSDIDIFHDAGILSPRAIFAHCTFLELPELGRLREAGSAVAHCPLSNAYFSTLPFCLREALDMGVKVGLGTDVAGGYQVDIMGAMRQAVITARMRNGMQTELVPGDAPFSVDWKETLYLATRGGAIALELNTGVLQPGAPWDAQRIDFFNGAGQGLGDMDFFDMPTMLTEAMVEKWW